MNIPIDWSVKCPYCKVITDYKTVRLLPFKSLTIKCEICGTELDIRPTQEEWEDWWQEISQKI